ncbi:NADP-dependent oxidoreductase [Pseudodonghicola flavimaris]|uniref:NADP-dependent oxidoreductase n=1 Tax=Pseudodonghicola flavimaris TaxID=3050036 RepID=A0ABT7F032_9RHOB|nr:NADP-dependent oxidoreductase [Pseudodonghicola flavimaris]MDK3017944.1 NADP-dependent oxidoreductase [Pseudodonghicola flavimaris]
MNLISQTAFGGPDVLRLSTAPDPVPGPGELRIAMAAAGINPVDSFIRAGALPLLGQPPFRLGWDIAGRVDALGSEVSDLAAGDRVMGLIRFPAEAGAYADKVIAPAAELVRTPAALSDLQAGALPLAGLTAWQALTDHAALQAGERILIHGGAGGVGHLAVQIAHACGAEVVATSSAGKSAALRQFGADRAIDYNSEDAAAAGPFDVILDPIGGAHADASLNALAEGGRLISLMPLEPATEARAQAEGKTASRITVRPDPAGLQALAGLAEAGKLTVHVAASFPLRAAAEAHAALAARPVGKIVLTP